MLVWLRGAIDSAQHTVLDAVRAAAAWGDRIVLDLSAVTFFGATGLNFLSGLVTRVSAPPIISGLPDFVRAVLVRSGLHTGVYLPVR